MLKVQIHHLLNGQVDAITSKTMSIKEARAAKLQELDNKAEEIVKEVHIYLFILRSVYLSISLEFEISSSASQTSVKSTLTTILCIVNSFYTLETFCNEQKFKIWILLKLFHTKIITIFTIVLFFPQF